MTWARFIIQHSQTFFCPIRSDPMSTQERIYLSKILDNQLLTFGSVWFLTFYSSCDLKEDLTRLLIFSQSSYQNKCVLLGVLTTALGVGCVTIFTEAATWRQENNMVRHITTCWRIQPLEPKQATKDYPTWLSHILSSLSKQARGCLDRTGLTEA